MSDKEALFSVQRERERNVFIFKIIDITYNINVTLHWYTLIYKKKEKK